MKLLEPRQWKNDGGSIRTCNLQWDNKNLQQKIFHSNYNKIKAERQQKHNGNTPQIFLENDPYCCYQDQRKIFFDQPWSLLRPPSSQFHPELANQRTCPHSVQKRGQVEYYDPIWNQHQHHPKVQPVALRIQNFAVVKCKQQMSFNTKKKTTRKILVAKQENNSICKRKKPDWAEGKASRLH
jgi:hypothetical protein